MRRTKILNRDWAELERFAKVRRTEEGTIARDALIKQGEREHLGRNWGKPRQKMEGWPK